MSPAQGGCPTHIQLDGVSIGIKKSRCRIERPFKPSASDTDFIDSGAQILLYSSRLVFARMHVASY